MELPKSQEVLMDSRKKNNSLEAQASGFIDIHSHLLPGIDDGCRNIEDSIKCVMQLKANGFVGTICTPHVWLEQYPHNFPSEIDRCVKLLRLELKKRNIEYELWSGGEVRLAEETTRWFEHYGVPNLADSPYVLIDYWGDYWPDFADKTIEYLFQNGFVPVLAHPERMNLSDNSLESLLENLKSSGVLLQGNLNPMTGREGNLGQQRIQRWLGEGRYSFCATDMHRPFDMDGRMEGIQLLQQWVGAEQQTMLLEKNQRTLLGISPTGDVE